MSRWELVQELFDATAELGAHERACVLRERAGDDDGLILEVEALVEADGIRVGQLDRTASDLLQESVAEPPARELCGLCFGPYRIDEHLSSGGMGHVYLATRTTAATERRVAIKVLRAGLAGAGFLERFQRERATLAALEHEHIVAFFDASALPDHRPYLVMEYVDGVPVTQWAAERGVGVRRRLELFSLILSAVQCAHHNLVVHRDIKPSNVLVNAHGVPKLLDFGIAAVLEPDPPVTTEPANGTAADPMTPGYASPEQLRGQPVTTASDVYSLGVLLREVLTAHPSDRALRGDLAAIVGKATALDPARRYASADRFADDLHRHLSGEPVSARPARWSYRAACFARRHRWPLVCAAAVSVALATGWIGSDLNRRRAERESSLGWGAHAQARFVSRVLEDLVASVAADHAELGDRAIAELESALQNELADLPEAEALTRLALGRLYLLRGQPDRARQQADRARLLCQTARGLGESDLRRANELRQRADAAGKR